MKARITRRLKYKKPPWEHWSEISECDIPNLSDSIVILGDPGSGKTFIAKALGKLPGMRYVEAGKFARQDMSVLLNTSDECVVVDGVDEIVHVRFGSGVDEILKKLSEINNPRFILTCRVVDWESSVERAKIRIDLDREVLQLYLQPFSYHDAQRYLSEEFSKIDARSILDQFHNQGSEDFYGNPLTLRLIGEVMTRKGGEGELPRYRAEILEQVCQLMIGEENPLHQYKQHEYTSEDLIYAAGAICGLVILCDQSGIHTNNNVSKAPDGFLHSVEIAKLPYGQFNEQALKTRLFTAESDDRFVPIHRVVAEYLGAKWLAKCCENHRSIERVLNLFHYDKEVPTSLRGLHAWTVHFSDRLAKRCIVADPIGVIKNGIGEHLSPTKARLLLSTLKETLAKNPELILEENWLQLIDRASGLIHRELHDEIRVIVENSGQHTNLTIILLHSMIGSDIVTRLTPLLQEVITDPNRTYAERYGAAKAIHSSGIQYSWEKIFRNLLGIKNFDSARLSFEVMAHVGANTVTVETTTEIVLAFSGLRPGIIPDFPPGAISRLFRDLNDLKLPYLLDSITSQAKPIFERIDRGDALFNSNGIKTENHDEHRRVRNARFFIADIVRRLAIRVLKADFTLSPERLWDWIGWLRENEGYDRESTERLAKLVCNNQEFRSALIEKIILVSSVEQAIEAINSLLKVHHSFRLTQEEIGTLLRNWHKRSKDTQCDSEIFRLLLQLGLNEDGSENIVYKTALDLAEDVPDLKRILGEESERLDNVNSENTKRQFREKKNQQLRLINLRKQLKSLEIGFANGNIQALAKPSEIYLGGMGYLVSDIDLSEQSPDQYLRFILGKILAEKAMKGFMAVLKRDDLPTISEIVWFYRRNDEHEAESSMICGVAEMLRRGIAIDSIDRDIQLAAYTAWRYRGLASKVRIHNDIGPALEKVLFSAESDWETYYRATIEVQLDHGTIIGDELSRLSADDALTKLAGRLAIEWLREYTGLSPTDQKELIDCMLRHSDLEAIQVLVKQKLAEIDQSSAGWLVWLSIAFVIDFDKHREVLQNAAIKNHHLLWYIKERISIDGSVSEKRGQPLTEFSLEQLTFIIQSFAESYPDEKEPDGSWSGDRNLWDASNFLKKIIRAISQIPSNEARDQLKSLLDSKLHHYANEIKRGITYQIRNHYNTKVLTVDQLQAVLKDGLPETVDDMRIWFANRIETLQAQLHGSDTDMRAVYWNDRGPQKENYCRNRLIDHISRNLPESIQVAPEPQMPENKRADIALRRNQIKLPIEIKGQWHSDLWNAASKQLAEKYSCDWESRGRGVYIVLWFGHDSEMSPTKAPNNTEPPKTFKELQGLLIEHLPDELSSRIDVYVIDVSKPL